MTKIATKSYTKRQLAAKAKRAAKFERMASVTALAFKATEEVQYEVNSWGYTTRLTPATPADVTNFFRGRRAFAIEECFEELGMGFISKWASAGYIKPYSPSINSKGSAQIYMITKKAAAHFNLPATINGGMSACYVD